MAIEPPDDECGRVVETLHEELNSEMESLTPAEQLFVLRALRDLCMEKLDVVVDEMINDAGEEV